MKKAMCSAMWAAATALVLTGSARAVDWNDERAARAFDRMDLDRNAVISVEEYRGGSRNISRDKIESNFRSVDANHDGLVTAQELRSRWTTANNVLRKDTWKAGGQAQARLPDAAFVAMDSDRDGYLSPGEFESGSKDIGRASHEFARIDDDNDGRLSMAEFREDWSRFRVVLRDDVLDPYPSRAPRTATVRRIETRETRTETYETAPAPAALGIERRDGAVSFGAMDSNADGHLTLWEYRAGGLLPKATAMDRFESMDRNQDGWVDRAEFDADWTRTH